MKEKGFPDKQKLREFTTTRPALQERSSSTENLEYYDKWTDRTIKL